MRSESRGAGALLVPDAPVDTGPSSPAPLVLGCMLSLITTLLSHSHDLFLRHLTCASMSSITIRIY